MKKINCWEYKNCKLKDKCIAFNSKVYDGINEGVNAGRYCWALAGTFCEGLIKGTFAEKINDCSKCDFYQLVNDDEDKKFREGILDV